MAETMMRKLVAAILLSVAIVLGVPDGWSAERGYGSQTNREGLVTVKVTPLALDPTEWRFEIVLDTHSVMLDQDMRAIATLSDGSGARYPAIAWDGDRTGGHHRKGVLTFDPIVPMPEQVTLVLGEIGVVRERTFVWTVRP